MIDVAQAYLERVVLEQFQETTDIKDKKQQGYVEIISVVCTSQIEKIKDNLEDGYMEAVKQKPYARWLISCAGKPDAVFSLVKAFDIPDSCLFHIAL
jgi:acyl-CoA oxidase